MWLVQSTIPVEQDSYQIHLVEQEQQGPYYTLQRGSGLDVERRPVLFQATTGKDVLFAPNAFPVSQQNQL